ncbi:protein obstructor-E-like [Drosophila elegans]|uniref:protein obstructor-E-like n=1 Tax=Drosophila elegans TaxID=30023 RepID=UPI0007E7DC46|nr:protein obstructor-E-like [Drosophila elegans]
MPKMMHHLTLLALAALIASCWAANGEVNICSNVVSNLFLPHVSNCSKYYLCMSEVAVPRECPADYYFDARDQQCVPVMEARCVPSCKARGLESFCYDRTCTKYVLCFDGTPVIQQCSDGLQYNAQTDRCDYPQYVDCADNLCIRQNNPDDIVYIASKAKCDKYFVCMNGLPMVQNCTSGLQYNPTTQSCDFPSRVNCTVENLQRNILPFARAPPRTADIKCPSEGVHFVAHQTRQDVYYYCLNGRGVTLDCTPGLVFDAKRGECREPQFVGV